jgi:hypothetical protein
MLDDSIGEDPLSRSGDPPARRDGDLGQCDDNNRAWEPHWAPGQNRENGPLLATSDHQMVIV